MISISTSETRVGTQEVATELFTRPYIRDQKADGQLSLGGFTELLSNPVCLTNVLG